ncbi:ribonuclease P protein subunit p40-like isoform X2 [Onthophagus taurus]|uniref:ribonuclease P protein subunit p40-like isoform X2 n=1 Tax=Onthophagus taurus TaxID=166361 RepID=UPI0039BDE3E0
MLCPEVWNFKPPPVDYRVESGKFEDNLVQDFHFNHLVSVTVPGSLKFPQELKDILTQDTEYYQIEDFNLGELIEEKFLKAFVNQGNLSCLSIDTNIDTQNCLCIIPNKTLILSLLKETYQSLGIQGKVSYFSKNNHFKYIIKVSLLDLKPNSAFHKKVKTALSGLRFNLILNWEPPQEEICASSIAKYIQDLGYKVKSCFIQENSHFVSPKVPKIDFNGCNDEEVFNYCEFLGMVALDADFDGKPNDYINTYEVPEPCENLGPVRYVQWRGFFTSTRILKFLKALRGYQKIQENIPWISLHVSGFQDAPISWGNTENRFFTDSEDSFTYFIKEPQFICVTSKSSLKQFKSHK